eukprot:jgi/Galph1/5447/GphlegSOOS_G4095.1
MLLDLFWILLAFHLSEILFILIYCPRELCWRSSLLSIPYVLAMCFAVVEDGIETFWLGKQNSSAIRYIGIALVVLGESIRKCGMLTLGSRFSHYVQPSHKTYALETGGIYRYIRHPAYSGWFIWAIGTQITLNNPMATVVFAYITYKFFQQRIAFEENILIQIYGQPYINYRKQVWSGIPFL